VDYLGGGIVSLLFFLYIIVSPTWRISCGVTLLSSYFQQDEYGSNANEDGYKDNKRKPACFFFFARHFGVFYCVMGIETRKLVFLFGVLQKVIKSELSIRVPKIKYKCIE
jgi:hypothetical protein